MYVLNLRVEGSNISLPIVAKRVAEFQGNMLDNHPLTVTLLNEEELEFAEEANQGADCAAAKERCLNFCVTGFSSKTTEDTLSCYLENSKRSGGGDIEDMVFYPDESFAEVSFLEVAGMFDWCIWRVICHNLSVCLLCFMRPILVQDAVSPFDHLRILFLIGRQPFQSGLNLLMPIPDFDRLTGGQHRLENQTFTVEVEKPKEEMPLDDRSLYVEQLNPQTDDECLTMFLEKFSDVEVEHVQLGRTGNALVTFKSPPGECPRENHNLQMRGGRLIFVAFCRQKGGMCFQVRWNRIVIGKQKSCGQM